MDLREVSHDFENSLLQKGYLKRKTLTGVGYSRNIKDDLHMIILRHNGKRPGECEYTFGFCLFDLEEIISKYRIKKLSSTRIKLKIDPLEMETFGNNASGICETFDIEKDLFNCLISLEDWIGLDEDQAKSRII